MKAFGVSSDEPAFDLLSKMLVMDPKKRIKSADALEHQYFINLPHPTHDVFNSFKEIPFPYRKYLTKKTDPPKIEQKARLIRKTHLQERNI